MDQGATGSALATGVRRWAPLAVLLAVAIGAYAAGVHRYLTIHALAVHRERLLEAVNSLGALAPAVFILVYAAAAALSIPGALILTLVGGFLFGTWLGTLYNLVAATTGATLLFLVARSAFGEVLQRRAGPFLKKMEAGFRENAVSYLLVLRLVPLFPFWLVNLVPALFGIPLGAYVACTFFGMIPAALVYTSVGAGLGDLLDRGEEPNFHLLLEPHFLLPLLALCLLALLPVAYKRWKRVP